MLKTNTKKLLILMQALLKNCKQIKLFDSQYEELNSKLTTLEAKEQWIKSFARFQKF